MRRIIKRRLIWSVFVIILVWLLAFLIMRFFLPEIVEVQESGSAQVIKDMLSSGVVIGTLITLAISVVVIIIIDGFISRKQRD